MKIVLVTPAGPQQRTGNRNTAVRWAAMLRDAGHRVTVATAWDGRPADLMLALHARRSHDSIRRFHGAHPERPLVVALTGTDLYRDIRHDASAQASLRLATLLITLQEEGPLELAAGLRAKARVVYQSARAGEPLRPATRFNVCVVGHLREEKDPFRCAHALALLPDDSRIRVRHAGRAMDKAHEREALRLGRQEPRYRWLGELPHWRARELMRRSHLMVISSRMEGGANVVSEALALRLPVLASRIPGNVGMLGKDYAGYFPLADEGALAALLWRAEREPVFYRKLEKQCAARRKLVTPERERRALLAVVREAVRRARQSASRG
jgi:putative glycosyltransferase (TIGR04348 family)